MFKDFATWQRSACTQPKHERWYPGQGHLNQNSRRKVPAKPAKLPLRYDPPSFKFRETSPLCSPRSPRAKIFEIYFLKIAAGSVSISNTAKITKAIIRKLSSSESP